MIKLILTLEDSGGGQISTALRGETDNATINERALSDAWSRLIYAVMFALQAGATQPLQELLALSSAHKITEAVISQRVVERVSSEHAYKPSQ